MIKNVLRAVIPSYNLLVVHILLNTGRIYNKKYYIIYNLNPYLTVVDETKKKNHGIIIPTLMTTNYEIKISIFALLFVPEQTHFHLQIHFETNDAFESSGPCFASSKLN